MPPAHRGGWAKVGNFILNLTEMAPFPWDKRSVRAAELVSEGRLTGARIAAEVGLSRQGLDRGEAYPEFKARVAAPTGTREGSRRRRDAVQIPVPAVDGHPVRLPGGPRRRGRGDP